VPAAIWWTGAGDGNSWEDALNWSPVAGIPPGGPPVFRVPGPGDDVTISAASVAVVINANEAVNSLNFTSPTSTITGTGSLTVSSFTLAAPSSAFITNGDLNVTGAFDWNIGALGGTGNVSIQGGTNIVGGAGNLTISGRNVSNFGTVMWTSGNIVLTGGSTITNAPGATFDALDDFSLSADPLGTGTEAFDNAGLFEKTGSFAGTATVIDCTFNNGGPLAGARTNVESDVGVLQFEGSGTHSATFTARGMGSVQFTNGTQTLQTGSNFQGNGLIVVSTVGDVNVPAGVTVANASNFKLDGGGLLQGSGITGADGRFINTGTFLWTGGTVSELRLINDTLGSMSLGGMRKVLDSSTLTNRGLVYWSAGNITMDTTTAPCLIANGGLFVVDANAQVFRGVGFLATSILNAVDPVTGNAGYFTVTGGVTATINVAFVNDTGAALNEGLTWGLGTLIIPLLTNNPGSIFIP